MRQLLLVCCRWLLGLIASHEASLQCVLLSVLRMPVRLLALLCIVTALQGQALFANA